MEQSFVDRYRLAVAGDRPLVFLGNFHIENQWAAGELGLPSVSFSPGGAVVNRMDEFALPLAAKRDHVVLKSPADPGYLAYLEDLGAELPTILVTSASDPLHTVSQDVLADPRLLAELRELAAGGALLAPHGVSPLEERIAARSGLPLATPSAAVCKAVNSKVYSRGIADRLGLRQPEGRACTTLGALDDALTWARVLIDAGRRVVLKDAYGASGKGLAVVTEGRRLDQIRRMIGNRARRAGTDQIGLVVEEWIGNQRDLNYQFVVGRDGGVRYAGAIEAIIENGMHAGNQFPARITGAQARELADAAQAIGRLLAADGYFGVVGVDALIGLDGELCPLIEINARNNMSTYLATLRERFAGAGRCGLAKHYPLSLRRPLTFGGLRRRLRELLFDGDSGLLINNFATVNAAAGDAAAGFDGRLYGLLIAESPARLTALDHQITARLSEPFEEIAP